jgi:DNA-binding transcriptional MerR regulator
MTAKNDTTTEVPPRRLVDTAELAEYLSVTPWAIREWNRRDLIEPAVRVGRVLRWDPDDVLAQLARARAEGRS